MDPRCAIAHHRYPNWGNSNPYTNWGGIDQHRHFASNRHAGHIANGFTQRGCFANPAPDFSPRGAVLDGDPVAVTPIALEGAPNSTQATDFGVLSSAGNFAVMQLLLAQENGMFTSYYSHDRPIANPAVADAVTRTSRRIYLFGKGVGETNIFVFGPNGEQIVSLDLA